MKLLIVLSFLTSVSASVVSLNPSNYDALTWGKTVFIKYFAPWCQHCQAMASDWEQLATQWADNEDGLIAEVDCDKEDNENMCKAAGVTGFPHLMFGTSDDMKEYTGARDILALNMFVEAFLKPVCSVKNIDLCSDEIKAAIEKYQKMSDDELSAITKKVKTAVRVSEDLLNLQLYKLQKKHDRLTAENKLKVKKAKDESDFSLVSEILESRGIKVEDSVDEDDDDEEDDDEDDDENKDTVKPDEDNVHVIDFNDLKKMGGGRYISENIREVLAQF